jgi:hypothetical protein
MWPEKLIPLAMICSCTLLPTVALVALIVWLVRRSGNAAAPSQAPHPVPSAQPAGWYPDPSGRHESRYWLGTMWGTTIRDGDAVSEDPL